MFKPAKRNSFSFKKLIVSKENVEKVVNPPQNPTVKNTLVVGDIKRFSLK